MQHKRKQRKLTTRIPQLCGYVFCCCFLCGYASRAFCKTCQRASHRPMSTPYRLSGNVEKTRCHLASKALRVALVSFSFLLFFFCRIHCKLCPGHGEAAAACCVGLLRGPEAAFHDPVSRIWQMKPARNEKVVLSCTFPCRERANMQQ